MYLAEILMQLALGKIPGVAEKTQIIYGTHSPLFVGIDRIDQIRLLRKESNGDGKPKITKVVSTSIAKVADRLSNIDEEGAVKYTASALLPRLQAIMTPWMNEGFFADVVVLVEGEDDRASILGVAKTLGPELESKGISVIPCGGKTNIDRPYIIFNQLGIPIYVVWDGDYGRGETEGICEKCERPLDKKPDPKENRRLLKLLSYEEIDWPEFIGDSCSCFKVDLETKIMEEIGNDVFEQCLKECQSAFSISKRKHALKNPHVIMTVINNAQQKGHFSITLKNIIEKIVALKK